MVLASVTRGVAMLRTITGVDDRGYPATITVAVDEPVPQVVDLAPSMLVGVTVAPDLIEQRMPQWAGARITRVFGYPGEGIPHWTPRPFRAKRGSDSRLQRLTAAAPDVIPNVVFRDWADDVTVASMVTAWVADLPVPPTLEPGELSTLPQAFLTWCHEPGPKGVDPALYRRRWMTLSAILADLPAAGRVQPLPTDALQWVMGTDPAKGNGDLSIYHTGVGWPAMDCYADSWRPTYPDPRTFLTPALRIADAAGTPPFLPELGAALVAGDTGERRAEWIRAVVEILRSEGCAGVCWWDNLGTGGTDLRLDDEPSRTAWQDAIAGRV